MVALETGVVDNNNTLFEWDGKKRRLPIWKNDLTFIDAFHFSCVPCYQEIARNIGPTNMNNYLQKFHYGDMDGDSSNMDRFWLEGKSTINQIQQIDFLKKFYFPELRVTDQTYNIMKAMMVLEKTDSYILSGKTGWSIKEGNNNGWFVGFLETQSDVYFFATNIGPKESFNLDIFPRVRKQITLQAFQELGIL